MQNMANINDEYCFLVNMTMNIVQMCALQVPTMYIRFFICIKILYTCKKSFNNEYLCV